MNRLVWIAVPNGRDGAALRLRVALAPRLEDGATLTEVGLERWPPVALDTAQIVATFATDPADHDAVTVPVRHVGTPDPALWPLFFPPGTAVRPPPARGTDGRRPLDVRPVSSDGGAAERIYRDVMLTPVTGGDDAEAVHSSLDRALADHALLPPVAPPAVAAAPAGPPPSDFHGTVALLREHPTVMRALGLVLEFEVAAAAVPPAKTILRISWADPPAGLPEMVSPWTKFELAADHFLPGSTATVAKGVLAIGDGAPSAAGAPDAEWATFTVDVDAAARRLSAVAASSGGDGPRATLPPMKAGGLALVRRSLGSHIGERRQRARNLPDDLATAVLDADDLTLGYRIDINRLSSSGWRSLMMRDARYRIGDDVPVGGDSVAEEGHLKHNAAVDYGDGVLRTDDVVARWNGWSLAAQRPRLDGLDQAPAASGGFRFDLSPTAGTLPSLRFTGVYQMRVRIADVAGGGLALDDPLADGHGTAPASYGRYEPIDPPDTALPPGVEPIAGLAGDTAVDITIRSDPMLTPETFAAANPAYPPLPARVLSPPVIALEMVERHGELDRLAPDDHDGRWAIVRRALAAGPAAGLPDPAASGVGAFLPPPAGFGASKTSNWSDWPDAAGKRIIAVGAPAGGPAHASWSGDDLVVALPQGSEAVLELSSLMREGYPDHFAAYQMNLPEASAALAQNGRHPLLTPPVTIRLTHAVRTPLAKPQGGLAAARSPGETCTVLDPGPPLLGLHAPSTAKLDVSAAWSEPVDDGRRTVEKFPVASLLVDPSDQAFRLPIRHEFGDTRHRRVTYALSAVSRFRRFFLASDSPELFVSASTLPVIDVPSSARPAVPVVTKLFPAFRWSESRTDSRITRTREALLRVELARPWFSSGEGEALAVILSPAGAAAPVSRASVIGRDPIWTTPIPPALDPEAFTAASGPAATVTLAETGETAIAVPHDVWFDAERGHWYADIAMPAIADASYAPLIRLAVARYQRQSLAGLELSPVVLCDFAPLLPKRTFSVEREEGGLTVCLDGLAPSNAAGGDAKPVRFTIEQGTALVDPAAPSALGDADIPGTWGRMGEVDEDLNTKAAMPVEAGGMIIRVRARERELIPPSLGPRATPDELDERVVFADTIVVPVVVS